MGWGTWNELQEWFSLIIKPLPWHHTMQPNQLCQHFCFEWQSYRMPQQNLFSLQYFFFFFHLRFPNKFGHFSAIFFSKEQYDLAYNTEKRYIVKINTWTFIPFSTDYSPLVCSIAHQSSLEFLTSSGWKRSPVPWDVLRSPPLLRQNKKWSSKFSCFTYNGTSDLTNSKRTGKLFDKMFHERAKKVVSDSPEVVDFNIELVMFILNLTAFFWGNSNYRSIVINPAKQKGLWG